MSTHQNSPSISQNLPSTHSQWSMMLERRQLVDEMQEYNNLYQEPRVDTQNTQNNSNTLSRR